MKTAVLSPKTEAEVWMHILHPDDKLSPEATNAILGGVVINSLPGP